MNFLANENFPLCSIKLLRDAGHNVVSVMESIPGAKDYQALNLSNKKNCVILTFDRDYGELIDCHKSLCTTGVVYFRFDPSAPDEPSNILLNLIDEGKVPILGKLTVIEKGRVRQRTLIK
jgi:predicted nuclease of predicted toxin-antitoxin system